MKNKIIILIILIMIVILFLLGTIFYIKSNENKHIEDNYKEDNVIEESAEGIENAIDSNFQLVTVKSYIQSFIEQINLNNVIYYTGDSKINEYIISKQTYNLLSKEYIEKNSITEETALEYVEKIEEKLTFIPLKINVLKYKNSTKYSIYGFACNQENEKKSDMYFILNVDNLNKTYSIEPVFNVTSINDIKLDSKELTIEKNRYNSFEEKEATEEEICEEYMIMYKKMMISNSAEAYKYLNSEYRDIKYSSLQEYERFIDNNKDNINNMVMKAYSIKGNKYVCEDDKNNFYIFNMNNVLDYTVFLDTYTADLPEFLEKYNNASAQEKVVLNINKIITALNAQDYKYIYSKLADSFKNNYFENEEALKEYLVNNLYENNEVEFEEFNQEGSIYTYKIKVKKIISEEEKDRYYGKNAPSQYINVVMQLNEGTDFVMSFSIDE